MLDISSQGSSNFVVVIIILLLLGLSFLLILFYNIAKRQKLEKEKKVMKAEFEKQLLQSQIEIQEQTFNTISQEIHDNIGQMLGLAKIQVNIMDHGESVSKRQVTELKETISLAMSDLRDIAHSLNTERIQSLNLYESISYQVERINRCGFMHVSIVTEGCEQQLEDHCKLILFRIIQESLQNIIKHSKATEVCLKFSYNSQLNVTISDDGIGFNLSALTPKSAGLGLQSIVKRASVAGGIASISSTLDKGTTVKITMPYA